MTRRFGLETIDKTMAEDEEIYLRQCLVENKCPMCLKPLVKKIGSGRFKDGVFCSLECYTKWHEGLLKRKKQ